MITARIRAALRVLSLTLLAVLAAEASYRPSHYKSLWVEVSWGATAAVDEVHMNRPAPGTALRSHRGYGRPSSRQSGGTVPLT